MPIASAGLADDLRAVFALGGADGVILTGRSPGETVKLLQIGRTALGDKPILAGGGVSVVTLADFLGNADGAIVSSSLKTSDSLFGQLEKRKVQHFMAAVRTFRAGVAGP